MTSLEAIAMLSKGNEWSITETRCTVDGVKGIIRFGDTDKFEISIVKLLDVPTVEEEREEVIKKVEVMDYDTLCEIEGVLSIIASTNPIYDYKLFCVRKRIEELDEEIEDMM